MSELMERTDGIPIAEVAEMFGCRVDTLSKRLKAYPMIEQYRLNRAVYVVPPPQWPVAWGQPKDREPSGTIPNGPESRALSNVPDGSGTFPPIDVVAGLVAQLSDRDQRIGTLSEQLRTSRRDVRRLEGQVDALNAALVTLRGIWPEVPRENP